MTDVSILCKNNREEEKKIPLGAALWDSVQVTDPGGHTTEWAQNWLVSLCNFQDF